jgi:hypothetical protein
MTDPARGYGRTDRPSRVRRSEFSRVSEGAINSARKLGVREVNVNVCPANGSINVTYGGLGESAPAAPPCSNSSTNK